MTIPSEYLRFSDAVDLLSARVFGGLTRPDPVNNAKAKFGYKLSVGFGPWKEKASAHLIAAALNNQISVQVFANLAARSEPPRFGTLSVPPQVLRRLPKPRGHLPDCQRVSLRAVDKDQRLFNALNTGVLVVNASEFTEWCKNDQTRGRWPSQRSRRNKIGRPSKQNNEALKNKIQRILNDLLVEGRRKIVITDLRRRLQQAGEVVPSNDTLARIVDRLHLESGRPEFYRKKRAPRGGAAKR